MSPLAHDYCGLLITDEVQGIVRTKQFYPMATHWQFRLDYQDKSCTLDLFARFAFQNFLGYPGRNYDLVVPDETYLKPLFGSCLEMSVGVVEEGDELHISSCFFAERAFELSLKRVID